MNGQVGPLVRLARSVGARPDLSVLSLVECNFLPLRHRFTAKLQKRGLSWTRLGVRVLPRSANDLAHVPHGRRHMKRIGFIGSTLLVMACDEWRPVTRQEARGIAASSTIEAHQGDIWKIQTEILRLKNEDEFQQHMISDLAKEIDNSNKAKDRELSRLRDHYNKHLRDFHGAP